MVHTYLRLDFTPGVNMLVGLNSSGKSACRRALEVLFYNAHPTRQGRFINKFASDPTDCFTVRGTFADGVAISRIRSRDSKTNYYLMTQGDEVLCDTRMNGTSVKLDNEVPEVIARYLGVYRVPDLKLMLNTRGARDPILLVETSGSENDKLLKDALQITELSEAFRLLNIDRNKVKVEFNEALITLRARAQTCGDLSKRRFTQAYRNQLQGYYTQLKTLEQIEAKLLDLNMLITESALIEIYTSVALVDLEVVLKLQQLLELRTILSDVVAPVELTSVDITELVRLQGMQRTVAELQALQIEAQELPVLNLDVLAVLELLDERWQELQAIGTFVECAEVDLDAITRLEVLVEAAKGYSESEAELARVELEVAELRTRLGNTVVCETCGTIIDVQEVVAHG